ncbi:hypothetical protein [Streptomyces pseudovenezuelae]|nr:hypothetical protein [Streptomyces pseudovenezuelae]WUA85881.1 hypothetical protein OHO81_00545 [Streptomyces pseudovenezuelae]
MVQAACILLAEYYRRDVEELVTAASALTAEHEPVEALRLRL